jgi:hypothetical protein
MSALALARATRRRHGAASWKADTKDSAMERELTDFIASVEENRKTSLQRRMESMVARRADPQAFKQALSARRHRKRMRRAPRAPFQPFSEFLRTSLPRPKTTLKLA